MSTNPVPPSTISSPRLHLIRLTDTSPGSQHVQWFHENWSDPVVTGWRYRPHIPHPSSYSLTTYPVPMLLALKHQSLHGATKSLDESRHWMIQQVAEQDSWFYAVFARDDTLPHARGRHLGSVALRCQDAGPELPPPATFDSAEHVGSGAPLGAATLSSRGEYWRSKDLNLRVLGYALFVSAQGKGYGTEACRSLLDGYAEAVGEWRAGGQREDDARETVFYVEAGVDQENPSSQNVLRKLGFRTVGLKIEKEKAWLNGGWRGPGWWITGLYI